jgi:hypothetical protein
MEGRRAQRKILVGPALPRFRGQSARGVTAASASREPHFLAETTTSLRKSGYHKYTPATSYSTYRRTSEYITRNTATREGNYVGVGLCCRRWRSCFLRTPPTSLNPPTTILTPPQGRAALVALRRSGGGAGALGRGFYKGGFEPKMTRREAALILEMPYVFTYSGEGATG